MRLFRKLFKGRISARVSAGWNEFTFPGDIINPSAVGVFAPPGVSGIWSGVYLARALQESYGESRVHFIAHRDFSGIAGFLPWKPEVHIYDGDPGTTEPEVPPGLLVFAAEPGDDLLRFVERTEPSACVSTGDHPSVNLRVKTGEALFPGSICSMMSVLDLKPVPGWIPETPAILSEKASAILSPVSHRTLPYILATEGAAGILERRRAEIPLKVVITDGKNPGIPPETDNVILAAMVAGASAVVTTGRDLWIHAVALGVPVIALDRKGEFTGWNSTPARGETQFLEQWASLIRRGW